MESADIVMQLLCTRDNKACNEEWIIFGAGRNVRLALDLLSIFGIVPKAIVDNDQDKWGTVISEIVVRDPKYVLNSECNIYISCSMKNAIVEQLLEMGIVGERIYDYSRLLALYVECSSLENLEKKINSCGCKPKIVIDAFDGVGWGGMEIWSYRVGSGLSQRGFDVSIYGNNDQNNSDEYERLIRRFEFDRSETKKYWNSIYYIANDILNSLPVVVINNWSNHVLAAALLVKKIYPDKVRIISFLHNDSDLVYEAVEQFAHNMDKIVCVSEKIKNTLVIRKNIIEGFIVSRGNFITEIESNENIRRDGEPIRLGWGGRLEIIQKRADLIPEFIKKLDEKNLDYVMEIAGDGSFFGELKKLINNRKKKNILLLGILDSNEMRKFWNRQNIYINFSEFEGASLAMLEAMSSGNVPIVTKVSGVEEYLINEKNGYYVEVGDLDSIVDRISELDRNENFRQKLSQAARDVIREKCSYEDYINFMEALISCV